MTVSRPPATGTVLIAAEAKALSRLQRQGPPLTLASRLTRDDATSCAYAAQAAASHRRREHHRPHTDAEIRTLTESSDLPPTTGAQPESV